MTSSENESEPSALRSWWRKRRERRLNAPARIASGELLVSDVPTDVAEWERFAQTFRPGELRGRIDACRLASGRVVDLRDVQAAVDDEELSLVQLRASLHFIGRTHGYRTQTCGSLELDGADFAAVARILERIRAQVAASKERA